jgi:hypothetical protein
MTEDELIAYLRIPEVSKSKDYHNVVENLKRMHQLPRIHICGRLHVSWAYSHSQSASVRCGTVPRTEIGARLVPLPLMETKEMQNNWDSVTQVTIWTRE